MNKYSKLSLITFFITSGILVAYLCIAAYIYDPLQIWHKPIFRRISYSDNSREAMKSIIRDNDFDSIIIGNSLSTNISSKEVSKKLNSKFLNISMDGSPPAENKIILNYLFKQKQIKNVVYFLGVHYLQLKTENPTFQREKYEFLYNNNKFDDYKIYLNDKYAQCIIGLSNSSDCVGSKTNIDKLYSWDGETNHMKRFGGFDNWLSSRALPQVNNALNAVLETPKTINHKKINSKEKKEIQDYLDKNIFNIVKENPKTQFYLVLPQTSSLEIAREIRSNDELNFQRQKEGIKYLASQSSKYNNLKIFTFEDLKKLDDIKQYKDLTHFHPNLNSYIINAIQKNTNRLTIKNVNKYINKTYKIALSCNFETYRNKIKNKSR